MSKITVQDLLGNEQQLELYVTIITRSWKSIVLKINSTDYKKVF